MSEVSWQAAPDGRYWIDVIIGGQPVQVMIDLGLVDPANVVGFELDPVLYEQHKRASLLSRFQYRFRRDANAQITRCETGLTRTQLLNPNTRQGIGPVIQVHVCCGAPGVPSRVGVVFFHRPVGGTVHWDLDGRTWRIECP